jgi:hypothetical protein
MMPVMAEHVADNIGPGQLVALEAELADGDSSSDTGYKADDEDDDEVVSPRWHNGGSIVRNLMQRRVRARLI